MQGVTNNFQTDLFQPIIKEIAKAAVKRSPGDDKELYAITDHVRAVVFSILDGILPSHEGRGYVVRKLIRKSILHMRGLGIHEPFLYKLVAIVCQVMHKPYPELTGRRENIAEIILAEEKNFISTLNSSDNLITETISPVLGIIELVIVKQLLIWLLRLFIFMILTVFLQRLRIV
jgi:alanyl-tRNA synthetase